MTLKQDVVDAKKELEDIKSKNHSIAYEIILDLKRTNIMLIIANLILGIALIISIIF